MPSDCIPPHDAGPIPAEYPPQSAQCDRSDRALRETARDQHGVLTLDQIEAAGLSPRALRDRAAGGRIRRVHAGIYAIDRADELRLFDLHALHEVLTRNPRRPGRRVLRAALAADEAPAITRSAAEERMLALTRSSSLPRPDVNVWIALADNTGYEADFLWPGARLIVEIDGREHHARRSAFTHDRRRDRRLALAGYETLRYAATELWSQPEQILTELRQILSHRAGPISAK